MDGNDVGDMECGNGILVSVQSSEKEGTANMNIISCRRHGPSSEYKDNPVDAPTPEKETGSLSFF